MQGMHVNAVTYAVPWDNTSQVCADSVQTVLLNLALICDHQVGGVSLQHNTNACKHRELMPTPSNFGRSTALMCVHTPSIPAQGCGPQVGVTSTMRRL